METFVHKRPFVQVKFDAILVALFAAFSQKRHLNRYVHTADLKLHLKAAQKHATKNWTKQGCCYGVSWEVIFKFPRTFSYSHLYMDVVISVIVWKKFYIYVSLRKVKKPLTIIFNLKGWSDSGIYCLTPLEQMRSNQFIIKTTSLKERFSRLHFHLFNGATNCSFCLTT